MVLVAKPAGPTSHDVVDIVRRVLDTNRVGHLGTLDPFAAGLLVLVVGRVTRLASFAGGWTKAYAGTIRLGTRTATDDPTGRVVDVSDAWRGIAAEEVAAALDRFRGAYEQRPPDYSAVQVGGERAYRRARRGHRVELAPRRVEVFDLSLEDVTLPDVRFRATVAAGTYLRSLARDVGEALGCGAHLAALTRTAVGPFQLEDAVPPAVVTADLVRDAAPLVAHLPRRDLDEAERDAVMHGRPVHAEGAVDASGPVALFAGGQVVGVAEREGDALRPRVVIAES